LVGCASLPIVSASAFATQQTFRDWRTDCDAEIHCILSTTVRDTSDTWLATVLVAANPDDTIGTMMQVLVPTGAHLASGVFVTLGRAGPVEAVYQSCAPQACLATVSLSPDDVAALRRNTKARIVYRPRFSTPAVTFDVSLMGFSAALAHAREVRQ
jgi:invasion protein IalB